MNTENQIAAGFEPLEEAQLVQQFKVEELEKRYEFGWLSGLIVNVNVYTNGYL